jgi:hypothetical protein
VRYRLDFTTPSEQNKLSIELDLTCRGYRDEVLPFRISIHADAVAQLIHDAFRGDRIYELFSILRHGDIKRYLWVRILEAAERIVTRYSHAEGTALSVNEYDYPNWDKRLALTWDEEPEECAWHRAKQLPAFKTFIDYWFDRALLSKKLLRQSDDIFIQNEIGLIDSGQHDYEYEIAPPFALTAIGFARDPVKDQYPEWFYEYLGQVLAQPDINSVIYRSSDLRIFRLLCTEQLKRSTATGAHPKDVFRISLLNVLVDGTPDNYFPRASRWGGYVVYSEEGLGHGDLFIDTNRSVGCSAKACVEHYWRYKDLPLYILTDEYLEEIKGYTREGLEGESLFLYKRKRL